MRKCWPIFHQWGKWGAPSRTIATDTLAGLVAEIERLRATLEIFANPDNWDTDTNRLKLPERGDVVAARAFLSVSAPGESRERD